MKVRAEWGGAGGDVLRPARTFAEEERVYLRMRRPLPQSPAAAGIYLLSFSFFLSFSLSLSLFLSLFLSLTHTHTHTHTHSQPLGLSHRCVASVSSVGAGGVAAVAGAAAAAGAVAAAAGAVEADSVRAGGPAAALLYCNKEATACSRYAIHSVVSHAPVHLHSRRMSAYVSIRQHAPACSRYAMHLHAHR